MRIVGVGHSIVPLAMEFDQFFLHDSRISWEGRV
jgi:hypothetical protein